MYNYYCNNYFNKQPRRKQRGILEQRQLIICMELLIGFTLILDVASYRVFIPMLANGTGKVTVSPKLSAPELLLHLGASLENLSCR